ncbi:MAG TPA: ABATE domain-containing protein [Trebonia sp.]
MSLAAAAALVNTGRNGGEELPDMAALDRFVARWRWTGGRACDQAELAAVRRLRRRLEHIWEMSADEAAELVNTLLREASALPQLVKHDGWDYTSTPRRPIRRWRTGWRWTRRWPSPT